MTRPNIPNKKPLVANKAQQAISQLLQQGIALWQKGQLKESQAIFDRVLALQPKNFDALQLSAIIAGQTNNFELALKMLDEVLKINPDFADAHSNRGLAFKGLKRFNEAIASFDRAIELKPDHFQAHYNRGLSLKEIQQYEDALVSYERAIEIKPDYADAYLCCGVVLTDLDRLNEALANFDRAIAINPDYAEAHSNRGETLRLLKRLEEALTSCDRAIAIKPDYAEAHSNHGVALGDLKRFDEALASYNRAIAINPDYAEAHSNRGVALRKLKRFDEALASYNRVIAINPDYAEAHSNRGVALAELKRFDEALASFDRAIAINPEYADANWNKSLVLLLTNNFQQGWELYEWRWKRENSDLKPRNFKQPLWLGEESIENKTILLHAEQGLGDTIQFCRYAKLVKERGAKVLLEVPKALMGLLKTMDGVDELLEKGKALLAFDYHSPLLSLPLAFKTELDTIPFAQSYLSVRNNKQKEWEKILGETSKLRVGLAWSGSTIHKNDHNRSLTLQEMLPYLPEDYEYVSLQKEVRESDKDVLATSGIKHFGEHLNDFTDTAALCELMDIVISVDTSVAHLAGALGKTTWIMLPYSPDWRWLLDRDDSPWYPTVKLYRQDKIGEWISVLEKMKSDLINHK